MGTTRILGMSLHFQVHAPMMKLSPAAVAKGLCSYMIVTMQDPYVCII